MRIDCLLLCVLDWFSLGLVSKQDLTFIYFYLSIFNKIEHCFFAIYQFKCTRDDGYWPSCFIYKTEKTRRNKTCLQFDFDFVAPLWDSKPLPRCDTFAHADNSFTTNCIFEARHNSSSPIWALSHTHTLPLCPCLSLYLSCERIISESGHVWTSDFEDTCRDQDVNKKNIVSISNYFYNTNICWLKSAGHMSW